MTVDDPIKELHRTLLYLHLVKQDSAYAERITTFVAVIAPILVTTQQHFPYYTRHDAHHGFQVTTRLAQVIDNGCLVLGDKQSLRPSEIFLLIAAAYAHDLGMTVFPDEAASLRSQLGLGDDHWKTDERLTKHLRSEHSKRGGLFIKNHADKLRVPNNLIGALDWMMRSHNLSIPDLDSALREPFAAEQQTLDVRQLAAILCIGDAIEFSDTRVLDGVLDRIKTDNSPAAKVSYRENRKHDCIRDSLALDEYGQVIVSGTFNEKEVLALAHRTFDQMEEWIRGYCDIDRSSSVPRLKIRPEPFRRRLELSGARFERLGVRMNKRSIIDLIASNAVWNNDQGIAVRELIQNAVESCRYREHRSSKADRFLPDVRVVFDRNARTIKVQDNGCGMSESTVLNHFLTVGSSRSKESAYADKDYASIARFGIGFWSVFTIAEKACIETSPFEQTRAISTDAIHFPGFAFDIALDEMQDYTVFETKSLSMGTSVTLYVKSTVVLDDVFERARGCMLVGAVSLTFVLDGEETTIPATLPAVTGADVLGVRLHAMQEQGVQVFAWQGQINETELAMAVAYRLEGGAPTFRANKNQSILSSHTGVHSMHFMRTAICGFQVSTSRERTCFAIDRVGYSAANHRSPRGFEFSIDRQSLVPNDAQRTFLGDVTHLVHEGYRAFLASHNANSAERIFKLNEDSELNGGNDCDQYTGSELTQASERWSDLLCFRLYQVDAGRDFRDVEPIYLNLEQLRQLKGDCFVVQSRIDLSLGNGQSRHIYPEHLPQIAYSCVQRREQAQKSASPVYVLDANRAASMLFDSDPCSTVEFEKISIAGWPEEGAVLLQRLSLANLQLNPMNHQILTKVHGRWSGAIYMRNFARPDGKPYVFLGRYRVLVNGGSPLHDHLAGLSARGRLVKIASLISDLQEDDVGFTPKSLVGLI